jgi:hypothetical protein
MNLQSPGEHTDWLAEVREYSAALASQDGPAAPIRPGCIAGHPDTWDIPADAEVEDILPW